MTHAAFLPLIMMLVGFGFGVGYFAVLRRTADLLAARNGWLGPSALTLARLTSAIICLALVAHLGAASLLATFAGFLLARIVAVRPTRRTV